ncbi:hypothetical protein [Methylocystis suflitae]|uniref:hypothetical protein n=1 Tax=Methylocystis suflitae TaxID=2951405 RepID=UPI0021097D27|nr:hypothetical protein [Methylocystis suflitae]MCQ4188578.1 hypothetical protein [Methylocystis suflitae]
MANRPTRQKSCLFNTLLRCEALEIRELSDLRSKIFAKRATRDLGNLCTVHNSPREIFSGALCNPSDWSGIWAGFELPAAGKLPKSRQWVEKRLRFGRFLNFVTTVTNTENLPRNITEGRFRSVARPWGAGVVKSLHNLEGLR